MIKKSVLLLILFFCPAQTAHSCTTFGLETKAGFLAGTNFDFIEGRGFILINRRGISKEALQPAGENSTPLRWTSKYGSATFNLWGAEFAYTGINEKGLVLSSLGLRTSKFPLPDTKPSIFSVQLVQYLLDSFADTEEVLYALAAITVMPPKLNLGRLHYFVCDKKGNCAVIEFLNGRMTSYARDRLPVRVLTNTAYEKSLECLKTGQIPVPDHIASIDRFIKTAKFIGKKQFKQTPLSIRQAFDILDLTRMGEITEVDGCPVRSYLVTEWSIVYDPETLTVYYKTFENQTLKQFNLSAFDLSCRAPVRALEIQQAFSGDVSGHFTDFNDRKNRALLEKNKSILPRLFMDLNENMEKINNYPGTTSCSR